MASNQTTSTKNFNEQTIWQNEENGEKSRCLVPGEKERSKNRETEEASTGIQFLVFIEKTKREFTNLNNVSKEVQQKLFDTKEELSSIKRSSVLPQQEEIDEFAHTVIPSFLRDSKEIIECLSEKGNTVFMFRKGNIGQLVTIKKEEQNMEKNIKIREDHLCHCESKQKDIEEKTILLDQKNNTGDMIWKIIEVDLKFTGNIDMIYHSSPFFIHPQGPKVRVSFQVDRPDVDVTITLLRSPIDEVLPWPLKKTVHLTLINPHNKSLSIKRSYNISLNKLSVEERNEVVLEARSFVTLEQVFACRINDAIYLSCSMKT